MGYDAHITRAASWTENKGHRISPEEWLEYVESDPELSLTPESGPHVVRWSGKSELADPWLAWSDGNISAKNPDSALLDKMIAIAEALDAKVQGDDGEVYPAGSQPAAETKPSVRDRLVHAFRAVLPKPRIKPVAPPFKIGDRVLDVYGRQGTVIELDPHASHGLGHVKVRYDSGKEIQFMLNACGLTPAPGAHPPASQERKP